MKKTKTKKKPDLFRGRCSAAFPRRYFYCDRSATPINDLENGFDHRREIVATFGARARPECKVFCEIAAGFFSRVAVNENAEAAGRFSR